MFSKLTPLAETNIPPLLCANAAGRLLHSDSRQIKQGDIFVACQGEYSDGRSYIPAAIGEYDVTARAGSPQAKAIDDFVALRG